MINLNRGEVGSELKIYVSFESLIIRWLTLIRELSGQGRRREPSAVLKSRLEMRS